MSIRWNLRDRVTGKTITVPAPTDPKERKKLWLGIKALTEVGQRVL